MTYVPLGQRAGTADQGCPLQHLTDIPKSFIPSLASAQFHHHVNDTLGLELGPVNPGVQ